MPSPRLGRPSPRYCSCRGERDGTVLPLELAYFITAVFGQLQYLGLGLPNRGLGI